MEAIHKLKRDHYRSAYDEGRARLLAEVDAAWATLISGESRPDADALAGALGAFKRVHHALRPTWRLTADLSAEERATRVLDTLESAVSVAGDARLSEGIDLSRARRLPRWNPGQHEAK